MEIEPTLIVVFLTGLMGGVHCAGMCGGIVGAIALVGSRSDGSRIIVSQPSRRRSLSRLLPYNAGRLASYTTLGALAGAAGSFGWLLGEALPLQQAAFALTNVLLVLMGLYVAGLRRIGHALEALGRVPWARIRPLATASLARTGTTPGAFAAGALWGLVPCGMVYAVLVGALLTGSALQGAALALAFGLGTLPNLLLLGVSGSLIARLTRRPRIRCLIGGTIALFGILGLLRLDVAATIPLLRELCVHLPGYGT